MSSVVPDPPAHQAFLRNAQHAGHFESVGSVK